MKKCMDFVKKELVLCIAMLLAIVSSFIVMPDKEYIGYIDFRTLGILFCLMSVMAGLQNHGVFRFVAEGLLVKVKSIGQLLCILVMLCFVFSMFITNDVALITFVPFTFTLLQLLGEEQKKKLMIPIVILQTIGANLGSMLTPVGNPQNLYLYGKAGISLVAFLQLMLPYTTVSFVMLLACCVFMGKSQKSGGLSVVFNEKTNLAGKGKYLVVYGALFVLSLLTVVRVVEVWLVFVIVCVVILLMDKSVLKKVDYSLLLTFIGFFVFIGNMGRVEVFRSFLETLVQGNEVATAIISSQVISNVPAALLLSGFTERYELLVIGVNLGGLGTLIASMASLISYKYLAKEDADAKGKYLLYFTVANVCFLTVLVVVYNLMAVI